MGFRFRVWDSEFRVEGLGWGLRFGGWGLGFGLGFKVWGLGFRVRPVVVAVLEVTLLILRCGVHGWGLRFGIWDCSFCSGVSSV